MFRGYGCFSAGVRDRPVCSTRMLPFNVNSNSEFAVRVAVLSSTKVCFSSAAVCQHSIPSSHLSRLTCIITTYRYVLHSYSLLLRANIDASVIYDPSL